MPYVGGTLGVSFFSIPPEASVATTYWGSVTELAEVAGRRDDRMLAPCGELVVEERRQAQWVGSDS